MITVKRIAWTVIPLTLMVSISACDETSSTSSNRIPPPAGQAPSPSDSAPSGDPAPPLQTDPEIELRVLPGEGDPGETQTAEAIVTFRTGGWDIVTDSAEATDGKLLWRVTITRPAPGEIVTQAFQTRTISHEAHGGPLRGAELHARVVVRGESASTPWSVFATWP